jgi:hypothetical protein
MRRSDTRKNTVPLVITFGVFLILSCNTLNSILDGYHPPVISGSSGTPSAGITVTSTPTVEKANFSNQTIGLIQVGNSYEGTFDRLDALGFAVELLPPGSGLETFMQYRIIYLPTGWAEQGNDSDFQAIEARAKDYLAYLEAGGSVLVEQPNPYERPDNSVTPSILPYPITFENFYDKNDWPPVIVNPDHFITNGLAEDEMPGPSDRMVEIDPAYEILVRGRSTNSPSLAVATIGNGRILILADTSNPKALRPFGDEVFRRMIEWLFGN